MKRWVIPPVLLAVLALLSSGEFARSFGQILEIPTTDRLEPVRLEISRHHRRVTLYRGELAVRSYPVAVGRPGSETPLGTFRIFQMLRDPAWKHPLTGKIFPAGDPGNELGHYWIEFTREGNNCVGFHGTPHPKTVGKPSSHGCVRMYEKDIAELFRQVNVGTTVTVLP